MVKFMEISLRIPSAYEIIHMSWKSKQRLTWSVVEFPLNHKEKIQGIPNWIAQALYLQETDHMICISKYTRCNKQETKNIPFNK